MNKLQDTRLNLVLDSVDGTHTTLTKTYDEVIFVIDGKIYQILSEEKSKYLCGKDIHRLFQIGDLSTVVLRTISGDMKHYFISFHDIPAIPPSYVLSCQSHSQIFHFSVYCFKNEKFIEFRSAVRSDENPMNFALGYFNVNLFIKEFQRNFSQERRIPVLWKSLVLALIKFGYFNICDYFNFHKTVFVLFQRMLSFLRHCPPNTILELFYSFFKKILMNRAWFFIVKESIQPIIGFPSRELIGLFLDHTNPPTVNFIDHKLGVVGLTKQEGDGFYVRSIFVLVRLQSTNARVVCSNELECCFDASQESANANILSMLFPSYDNCPPLRRTPASINTSAITQGFSRFGPLELIIFKIGNSINVFIKRSDGTFDNFNFYFFILSKMFAVGDELDQLTNHFTHRFCITVENLVKGLLEDGFLPIFDKTATTEQIIDFLFKSDFGCVLQGLRHEIEGFLERLHKQCLIKYDKEVKKGEVENPTPVEDLLEAHLNSIRENDFIMDFKRIFEFLLEKLGNRDDLTPEIREILHFLGQLVEFLNSV